MNDEAKEFKKRVETHTVMLLGKLMIEKFGDPVALIVAMISDGTLGRDVGRIALNKIHEAEILIVGDLSPEAVENACSPQQATKNLLDALDMGVTLELEQVVGPLEDEQTDDEEVEEDAPVDSEGIWPDTLT